MTSGSSSFSVVMLYRLLDLDISITIKTLSNILSFKLFKEVSSGKDLAWSRGLGLELSPVKTRSARKKMGTNLSLSTNLLILLLTRGRLEASKPSQGKSHDYYYL
jgi:hypothetical protein